MIIEKIYFESIKIVEANEAWVDDNGVLKYYRARNGCLEEVNFYKKLPYSERELLGFILHYSDRKLMKLRYGKNIEEAKKIFKVYQEGVK